MDRMVTSQDPKPRVKKHPSKPILKLRNPTVLDAIHEDSSSIDPTGTIDGIPTGSIHGIAGSIIGHPIIGHPESIRHRPSMGQLGMHFLCLFFCL